MRIQTKVVYNWNERLGKYILVETDGYDYLGTVFACKGASSQQTGIANSQQNFMNTLQQDFGTAFSGQQNILNSLTSNLTGILNAGPSQYGFSAPEESALNTLATSGNAQQYANAKAAAGQAAAAAGGGNAVIPTSAASQQQAGIAEAGAQQQSNELLGIKQAGYAQGNENWKTALGGLTTTAGLENPSGIAGAANTAGSDASQSATTVAQMNNAASPWNVVGGILGGVGSAALNFALPGAGSLIGGALGSLGEGTLKGMTPDNGDGNLPNIPDEPMTPYGF
jgi:hypothetical protein